LIEAKKSGKNAVRMITAKAPGKGGALLPFGF
jgi:hypothetical protein